MKYDPKKTFKKKSNKVLDRSTCGKTVRNMSAPVVTIYRNGDLYFLGKKLVVNPKRISTFDNFLDKVTQDTHARVAIRRICTPNHGSRVLKLDQLQNGGVYVAVGPEKFKQLHYNKLQPLKPLRQQRTVNENVKPVVHSRLHASARYKKAALAEPLRNRIIYVFRNGEPKHPGIKLLLDKRILQDMDTVLQHITHKVKLRTGAVRCLVTMDGLEVKETKDIETGTRYVAVGYGKAYIKAMYQTKHNPFSITPRRIGQSKNSNSPLENRTPRKSHAKERLSERQTVGKLPDDSRKDTVENRHSPSEQQYDNLNESSNGKISVNFLARLTDENINGIKKVDRSKQQFIGKKKKVFEKAIDNFADGAEVVESTVQDVVESKVERQGTFEKNREKKMRLAKKKANAFGSSFDKDTVKISNSRGSSTNSDYLSNSHNNAKGRISTLTDVQKTSFDEEHGNEIDSVENETTVEESTVHSGVDKRRKSSVEEDQVIEDSSAEVSGNSPRAQKNEDETETELHKSDSPRIFDASGDQGEKAQPIKDNRDTAIEKTIDMEVAEEVEDEEVEDEIEDGDVDEIKDGDVEEVKDRDVEEVKDGDVEEVKDGDVDEDEEEEISQEENNDDDETEKKIADDKEAKHE